MRSAGNVILWLGVLALGLAALGLFSTWLRQFGIAFHFRTTSPTNLLGAAGVLLAAGALIRRRTPAPASTNP